MRAWEDGITYIYKSLSNWPTSWHTNLLIIRPVEAHWPAGADAPCRSGNYRHRNIEQTDWRISEGMGEGIWKEINQWSYMQHTRGYDISRWQIWNAFYAIIKQYCFSSEALDNLSRKWLWWCRHLKVVIVLVIRIDFSFSVRALVRLELKSQYVMLC